MAKRWTVRAVVLTGAALTLGQTGCSTMSNTGKGAAIGGALGTGAGALVGAATGNPKTGAVVGGLLGAGTGGLIGADVDAREKEKADIRQAELQAAQQQQYARPPLSVQEVVDMSQPDPKTGTGVGDQVIIDYIRTTNSRFDLTPQDIKYLKGSGVTDRVIQEMVNSRGRAPVAITGPRPQPTVVIHEPAPPPDVVFVRPYPRYYHPRPWCYAPPPRPGVFIGGYIR